MQTQPVVSDEAKKQEWNEKRLTRVRDMLERNVVWFAMLVAPQKEMIVEKIMELIGLDAYTPIEFRYRRVNSRQKVRKYVPYVMASRYVFLGFPRRPVPWDRVLGTGLFSGVLGHDYEIDRQLNDFRPIEIPPATMRSLFVSSGEEAARASAVRLNRSIVTGDTVLITDGPFRGHQVKIDGIDRHKASVIVELFQTAQRIEITLDALEAV